MDAAKVIGTTLDGRYRINRLLGQGGMGVVYEADHIGLDKKVAIKFLLDKFGEDSEVISRFHQEARTASRIGHDHIVDVLDIGQTPDGRSFMVLEYLEGSDLAGVLTHAGPMHPERAVRIIGQVLRGLSAAHDKGIIHRDMKPENVFLTRRGERDDFVKIMDFGISKIIDAHDSMVRLTKTGAVVGTPIYMAPEQARAEQSIDHRADVYAVGVMLYELLAGQPPFMANNYLELVTQHLFDTPPPLSHLRPDLPPLLEQIIMRALAKSPADRWPTAADFAAALPAPESFTGSAWDSMSTIGGSAAMSAPRPPVAPAPTTTPERAPRRRSMAPFVIIGGAVVVAGIMIALTLALVNRGGEIVAETVADPPGERAPAVVLEPSVVSLESVLEVDSRPQGARVFVDDELRGETPITVRDVRPGIHTLRIEKDGYQSVETSRELDEGDTETFFAALATEASGDRSEVTRRKPRPTAARKPAAPTAPVESKPETAPVESKPQTAPRKPETAPKKPETKPNPYLEKKPSPY